MDLQYRIRSVEDIRSGERYNKSIKVEENRIEERKSQEK
jgi:hypothetical protein